MTRTGLFLSALGVLACACQATHAEASRPIAVAVVPPPVTTTTTTSHTLAAPPPPPRNVCEVIDKSTYDLGPLETHVGTVMTLPPLPPIPTIVDDGHDLAPFYAKLAKLA